MKPHSLFLLLFFLLTGDGWLTPVNACNKNKTAKAVLHKIAETPGFTELVPFNHMLL
ncbi:hypothetical protein IQ13_3759 [Lacibacter cauensis]|uniref:Uncharacterized protein n=1 Tax=Lacibacter cauensis TaxID=510947 RepID=A0A562SDI5_9BACT|nr:hypothetical protein [Lacibacter cauensis]TWI79355.1 hypothetical protein IQ13_3759 [Lacibacter cauensis]